LHEKNIMTASFCCHDAMRTTVTLDPDVEALLREAVRERGEPFKQVLNAAVRAGLEAAGANRQSLLGNAPSIWDDRSSTSPRHSRWQRGWTTPRRWRGSITALTDMHEAAGLDDVNDAKQ